MQRGFIVLMLRTGSFCLVNVGKRYKTTAVIKGEASTLMFNEAVLLYVSLHPSTETVAM